MSGNIRKGVAYSNMSGYRNGRVDALLEQAGQEMDPAKRAALYKEFQKIVADEAPIAYLNVIPYYNGLRQAAPERRHQHLGPAVSDGYRVLQVAPFPHSHAPPDSSPAGPPATRGDAMQTLALIGRRILYAALLLLAVIVLNFTLIRLAPGDIVQTIAGQMGGMNEELMLELRTASSPTRASLSSC